MWFSGRIFVLFQKQSSGSKAKKHSKSSYQLPNSSRSEGLIFARYDFESHVLPGYLEGQCLFSSAGNNSFGHLWSITKSFVQDEKWILNKRYQWFWPMAVKQLKLLIGWRRISTVRPGRRKREFWGQQPHNSLLPCVIFFSQNFLKKKRESTSLVRICLVS